MSKQYDIKFVIIMKILISDIKLVLFYIIFKNNIVNKKRLNLIDEFIFKSQYFNAFFNSNSTFNFNFDVSRKININILNL